MISAHGAETFANRYEFDLREGQGDGERKRSRTVVECGLEVNGLIGGKICIIKAFALGRFSKYASTTDVFNDSIFLYASPLKSTRVIDTHRYRQAS